MRTQSLTQAVFCHVHDLVRTKNQWVSVGFDSISVIFLSKPLCYQPRTLPTELSWPLYVLYMFSLVSTVFSGVLNFSSGRLLVEYGRLMKNIFKPINLFFVEASKFLSKFVSLGRFNCVAKDSGKLLIENCPVLDLILMKHVLNW